MGTVRFRPPRPVDNVSYWDGDGIDGKPSVKISLGEQRAYFYKGGQLVGISQLSTGREGLGTPIGQFSHHSKRHRSRLEQIRRLRRLGRSMSSSQTSNVGKDPKPPGTHFKGAPMPYFMRIVGGVGMHAGYLPGYPASHGCIRMPEFMAENFFKSVSTGTPVTITQLGRWATTRSLSACSFDSARRHSRLSRCRAMIIITQPNATEEQIERIVARVREFGLEPQISRGASRVIIGVIGAEDLVREKPLAAMPGVEAIVPGGEALQTRFL